MVYKYGWDTSFQVFVSGSLMSLNGLSFASARPAPQPCVSVLVVQEIQETVFNMCVITSAQKWRILKISSAIPIPKQAQQTSPKPL